ncbi:MAG: MetQ/NlpA family ABC transporter substrate-binding protein [Spirochaetaceae bacterium]|jgi:D-methionine transport system substrate-binding protein|nr:MetQ/NlpA family ABC transporter substrate-binding protein [Spirochaetaceae bacterium]
MKRFFANFGVVVPLIAGLLSVSCLKKDGTVLTIGATPQPHAQILNFIKDDYKKKGFTLNIVEFTDYVAPNSALLDGSIDANFFQHIPYLEERDIWANNLVSAFGVHVEPFALYSLKYKNTAEIPDGALIAIPNDPTNGGRALLLLEAHGLITLKPGVGLIATELDIVENPHNFKFAALESAALPPTLKDVDAACINGNYALQAGLSPARDSLIIEGAASQYVNIVVVRKDTKNDPRITALEEVMLTDKVRNYVAKTWPDGNVMVVF